MVKHRGATTWQGYIQICVITSCGINLIKGVACIHKWQTPLKKPAQNFGRNSVIRKLSIWDMTEKLLEFFIKPKQRAQSNCTNALASLFLCVVSIWHKHVLSYGPLPEKTCLRGFGNNTGADQPAHPHSLISAFVIRFLEASYVDMLILY